MIAFIAALLTLYAGIDASIVSSDPAPDETLTILDPAPIDGIAATASRHAPSALICHVSSATSKSIREARPAG